MSTDRLLDSPDAPMPLAYNTRDGKPLDSAGVFRDAEGRWWSIQARKPEVQPHVPGALRSHLQDKTGRVGHVSFVRLTSRPHWLTRLDKSNLKVALELNQLLYKGNVKMFRSQDEADEAFASAHAGRGLFVTRGR